MKKTSSASVSVKETSSKKAVIQKAAKKQFGKVSARVVSPTVQAAGQTVAKSGGKAPAKSAHTAESSVTQKMPSPATPKIVTKTKELKTKSNLAGELGHGSVKPTVSPVRQTIKSGPKKFKKGSAGLSAAQIRELESKLRNIKVELSKLLVVKAQAVVGDDQSESIIKGDDAEVAEKQRLNNANLQELDILKNRMAMVQRALRKLTDGVYGLCEETEECIGYDRLLVVPWARYCVNVQEARERKMREFRTGRNRAEV